MAIKGVDTKCYILALFVRDDGERFLLGSGHYEFKDTQMHFAANAIQNDIVEVQGNDGFLLAGQVRRPGTQSFDGYVGDGTMSKEETESYRRQFFSFFRKNFFYKVIYVFSDGTAIQRKSGFLVDDPTVEELYQMYPEYHVALNFEDVNYYSYSEDEEGQEQYAKEATIDTSSMRATGGLVWDNLGVVWEDPWGDPVTVSGTEITIQNDMSVMSIIDDVRLDGDTEQQTYIGFQLLQKQGLATSTTDTDFWHSVSNQTITALEDGWARFTSSSSSASKQFFFNRISGFSWEVATTYTVICEIKNAPSAGRLTLAQPQNTADPFATISVGEQADYTFNGTDHIFVFSGTTKSSLGPFGLRSFFNVAFASGSSVDLRLTIVKGDHTSDYQNYIGDNWEPYVGGIPSPNPYYPQDIQVMTGEQTVEVHGKNLFDKNNYTFINATLPSSNGTITSNVNDRIIYMKCEPNTTYTFTKLVNSRYTRNQFAECEELPQIGTSYANREITYNSESVGHYTTSATAKYLLWLCYNANAEGYTQQQIIDSMMVEQGSTASAYEPYRAQSYTIDLGSTELCKIGDYQDYIYRSGDDWYVHKEVSKYTFTGDETFNYQSAYIGFTISSSNLANYMPGIQTPLNGYSDYFIVETSTTTWTGEGKIGLSANGTFWAKSTAFGSTQQSCEAWLSTNTPAVYYVLATATDTQITDATLIGQLNALGAMKLFVGENNLSVEATGANLPAPLSFKYYTTLAMTGAEWEEGGSGGATVVEVDSITNTYPIWRVEGPAVNPQLSVINTNTTIRYTGTVTSTQTLEIDMFNKTAKLNGVSVIGNVSGDWVSLAPGTNRVIYTAENADARPSVIEWQEVVG